MTWSESHQRSEALASDAFLALRSGQAQVAETLYAKAAQAEEDALHQVEQSKRRTLGITAVSAVSLWFKAREFRRAEQLAFSILGLDEFPEFASNDLRLLVQAIWTESSKERAGVSFLPGQVMVSVKGGEVVTGGAPLDLIVDKVQAIQVLFYRTIEFIKNLPHRQHGRPIREIQEACRPWLFQAPPGSYQFSVVIQEPAQKDFFKEDVKPEQVARHFLEILKATANEEPQVLEEIVPDAKYRSTFLKLARNLAPTGRTFDRMEIKAAGDSNGIFLLPENRSSINKTLRKQSKTAEGEDRYQESITGILRAVHLDKDWLDVTVDGKSVHIEGIKDAIDDLIGPMVNRQVIVRAVRSGKKKRLRFIDIEPDE